MEDLQAFILNLQDEIDQLKAELTKAYGGNASAAKRARKQTINLQGLFKEYRALSVATFKKTPEE